MANYEQCTLQEITPPKQNVGSPELKIRSVTDQGQ